MASNGGRYGKAYYALRARVIREETHCAHPDCGQPVDKTLSGRHPLGPTLDHKKPISRGGNMLARSNAQLMHRHCNTSKGTDSVKPPQRRTTGTPSRDW